MLTRPTLADVRRAFAEIPARFETVNKNTGEVRAGRVTIGAVCKLLGCRRDAVEVFYGKVRDELERQRAIESFDEMKVYVDSLSDDKLIACIATLEAALTKNTGKPREAYHRARRNIACYELRRRGLAHLRDERRDAHRGIIEQQRKQEAPPVAVEPRPAGPLGYRFMAGLEQAVGAALAAGESSLQQYLREREEAARAA